MRLSSVLLPALLCASFSLPALAPALAEESAPVFGDSVSLSIGTFDFARAIASTRAVDMRINYLWGMSLLSKAAGHQLAMDKYFQIHPFVGFEGTEKGQTYGTGGFAFDILLGDHIVVTPSLGVGLYAKGDGKRMGSTIEFRSTLEGGFRFDNDIRVMGYISHISNARISYKNPGAEMLGMTFHIPTNLILNGSDKPVTKR